MNKKLKIAIIGTGSIAENHIHAYQKNPQAELYAFCDISEKRLQKMGEKYGVTRLYTDKDAMLAELPEIDAVSVCTWNSAHAPCTIAALKAGKHVLCEKPMATSAPQAREMLAAAREAGKLLMVGFVRRYGNDCHILKEFVNQGYFGDIYYSKATYLRRNGSPGGWFGMKEFSAGGPLIDLGVHVIDLTRYIMGNPRPVSVYGATFHKLGDRRELKDRKAYTAASATGKEPFDVEDLATAMIRYDNGSLVSVEASFSLNLKQDEGTIQFFGTKAGARLNPELELYTETNGYMADVNLCVPTALSFDGLFENEINHYVDCIQHNIPCVSPAEDGVTLMEILDAIYESARTGHEVVINSYTP